MRAYSYPTGATGETPVQSFGAAFDGRDDYDFHDWTHTAGYLDAPDLIPAGSHTNSNFDQVPVTRFVAR